MSNKITDNNTKTTCMRSTTAYIHLMKGHPYLGCVPSGLQTAISHFVTYIYSSLLRQQLFCPCLTCRYSTFLLPWRKRPSVVKPGTPRLPQTGIIYTRWWSNNCPKEKKTLMYVHQQSIHSFAADKRGLHHRQVGAWL